MKRKTSIPAIIFMTLFLGALVIAIIYPVIYMVLGSFKTNMEFLMNENFLPEVWRIENYVYAFFEAELYKYVLNTVILCAITIFLDIIVSSMAGFCLARYKFPGHKFLSAIYLSLMFIAVGSTTIYPLFLLMHDLGLTNNLFGLALVLTGSQSVNVFLVVGFVRGIPRELDEAATIDGCTLLTLYWRIIFPLIRPIVGVIGLFSFQKVWNDYITSMIFTMSAPELKPLVVAVVGLRYSVNAAAEWHIIAAGACIAILPMLLVYVFTSKQFISGLTAGAVKG